MPKSTKNRTFTPQMGVRAYVEEDDIRITPPPHPPL